MNHYKIVKNMMGSLMEEPVGTWNYTRSSVLHGKTKILGLDTILNRRDAMGAWKILALGICMMGEGESASVSAVPSVSMDIGSVPVTPHSSSTPFLTSSTIA